MSGQILSEAERRNLLAGLRAMDPAATVFGVTVLALAESEAALRSRLAEVEAEAAGWASSAQVVVEQANACQARLAEAIELLRVLPDNEDTTYADWDRLVGDFLGRARAFIEAHGEAG